MTIIETIDNNFKDAMRAKDEFTVGVLRMLKASFKNKAIDLRKELTEEDAMAMIRSEIKKRQDAALIYEQGNRIDLKDKELSEIKLLEKYLPTQMSEEEVKLKIAAIIANLPEEDKNDFGKAMRAVMAELKGKADGGLVRKALKEARE
ncbi:MAG: GatB/YqeY domain-containing protein [Parcubacteria group bacterium]